MRIDHNWFYANNLDVYRANNPFEALVLQPVGTGFFWPGNNDGDFLDNWVFDNWRQGAMLISIPDALAGEAEGAVDDPIHCPTGRAPGCSTSCYNIYRGNNMGQVPPNFKPHPGLTQVRQQDDADRRPPNRAPNGIDFAGTSSRSTSATAGRETPGPTAPGRASTPTRSIPRAPTRTCRRSCPSSARSRRPTRAHPATTTRRRAWATRAATAPRPRSYWPASGSTRAGTSTPRAAAGSTPRRSRARPASLAQQRQQRSRRRALERVPGRPAAARVAADLLLGARSPSGPRTRCLRTALSAAACVAAVLAAGCGDDGDAERGAEPA